MASNIDPTLPEETSGPNIGKVLISRLRQQLETARGEITQNQDDIAQINQTLDNLDTAITTGLAGKLNNSAASGFATAAQGAKADSALQPVALGDFYTKSQGDARYPVLVAGTVPAANLPSYVDDVLEYASLAAMPVSGVSGKIFVALDTNKTYRWSGTAYVEISASPGSTDAVVEGTNNLYFSAARVRAAILTGLDLTVNAAITAADTVLAALGKLQKQITDHIGSAIAHLTSAQQAFTDIVGFAVVRLSGLIVFPSGLLFRPIRVISLSDMLSINPMTNAGQIFYVPNIGQGGSYWISIGTSYKPLFDVVLFEQSEDLMVVNDTVAGFQKITECILPGGSATWGGVLGVKGRLEVEGHFGYTNSAVTKNLSVQISDGTTTYTMGTRSRTASVYETVLLKMFNRNRVNSQRHLYTNANNPTNASTGTTTSNIDTSKDCRIVFGVTFGTVGTGANTCTMTNCKVVLAA